MQQRPSAPQLLHAVNEFLAKDVASAISDRALRFRMLIAGNLLGQLAADLVHRETFATADLERLSALLDAEPGPINAASVVRLETLVAQRIRNDELDEEQLIQAREALLASHGAYLAATDPNLTNQ